MRPQFSVVTRCQRRRADRPLCFSRPAWDAQLSDAYTAGRAEHLLQSRGLGVLFGSSVYRGTPAEAACRPLPYRCRDSGRGARGGRGPPAASSPPPDVDTGESVVWDLGSIAMNGGRRARTLFRDVLVASASVPGMFPPVIIRVQEEGEPHDEAHVDGNDYGAVLCAPGVCPDAPRCDRSDSHHGRLCSGRRAAHWKSLCRFRFERGQFYRGAFPPDSTIC